jgi:hypothetical protein
MYTENTQPNFVLPEQPSPSNQPPKSKPVMVSVAAEWWQVLTIVTVILSVASVFLAFNQIQPEVYRNEFLAIDQAKASVYLIHEETNRVGHEEFSFLTSPKVAKLCEENYTTKLTSEDLDRETLPIREREHRLQSAEEDAQSKVQVLAEDSGINELFTAANTTLVEKRLFFEKKFLLDGNKANIYRSLSSLCQNQEQALAELNTIAISLDDLSDLEGLDRQKLGDLNSTIENWKRNVEALDFQKVFKETPEVENFVTELNQLDQFHQKFVGSKNSLQEKFSVLEEWQLEFTDDNLELRAKLVLIEEIEHGSTT